MGTTNSKEPQQSSQPTLESDFTCEICIEPMTVNKKFNNRGLCSHPFCVDCIIKYIHVKVSEYGAADVACPGLNCPHLLDPLTCQQILPPEAFVKWCDVLCVKAVLGFDNHCYCPNRDCSVLVVSECGTNIQRSTCPNCKKLFCFKCKLPWHSGYRCEESEEMRDQTDVAFGALAERRKWMRCPNCNHCVELVEGCNIVKCRCETSFCYKCGSKVNYHMCKCGTNTFQVSCFGIFIIICIILMILFLYFSTMNQIEENQN